MSDSFWYKLNSGKPWKLGAFIHGLGQTLIPSAYYRRRLPGLLAQAKARPDAAYIQQRVDYYIRINQQWRLPAADSCRREASVLYYTGPIGKYTRRHFHTAYYLDQYALTRYFDKKLRWHFYPGDVYFTPNEPAIVKSRLLCEDNQNAVVLKLDKLRHFLFIHDTKPWQEKKDKVIFRGKIRQSRLRRAFMQRFWGNERVDCGVVGKNEGCPEEWMVPKMTIQEHLDYKYIMALEGNDVASNLKWVMSSNSIAVMTRPTCETWFMEGTLIAGIHYIEVAEDFSDLEEKIAYYNAHPDEAVAICEAAHGYVAQFQDVARERLIGLQVLAKYFEYSGQL